MEDTVLYLQDYCTTNTAEVTNSAFIIPSSNFYSVLSDMNDYLDSYDCWSHEIVIIGARVNCGFKDTHEQQSFKYKDAISPDKDKGEDAIRDELNKFKKYKVFNQSIFQKE